MYVPSLLNSQPQIEDPQSRTQLSLPSGPQRAGRMPRGGHGPAEPPRAGQAEGREEGRCQVGYGGQSNSPAHVEIPGSCESASSLGRRDFVGAIQVRDLGMGRLSWCPNLITQLLKSRETFPAIVS